MRLFRRKFPPLPDNPYRIFTPIGTRESIDLALTFGHKRDLLGKSSCMRASLHNPVSRLHGTSIADLPEDYEFAIKRGDIMGNIFYIIGVIVVVLFILGYLGLR